MLIANRGEIAVRVIRACKELGVTAAAIYSDVDALSLHVFLADEAYRIGPEQPEQSYLNAEKIVELAARIGAEAIHPGYGFLSQNPEFVRLCEKNGIVFIGPPAEVHELAGNKIGARNRAKEIGIKILEASPPLDSVESAVEWAEKIGFPVIVKPVGGGGGIGMQVCRNAKQLEEAFLTASKLAQAAFAKGEVFLEKYIPKARHIEVQILADQHGNVIHLGERECTIQRRFQKVLEEAPSPALTERDDLREELFEAAVKYAEHVGYVNAGTVEFLYSPVEEEFYFLELNSRIQVEHPVTESITHVDIVKEQIRIACGEELRYAQEDIEFVGHAMELRIYAEDPLNGFKPCPSTITTYIEPKGIGVRVESSVYAGYTMPSLYDPLIAKLVVWGNDRQEAIVRAKRALDEFIIGGVKTNKSLFKAILEDEAFVRGELSTTFIRDRGIIKKVEKIESVKREKQIPLLESTLEQVKVEVDGRIATVTWLRPLKARDIVEEAAKKRKVNTWVLTGRMEAMR